jgi:hypothetical protein
MELPMKRIAICAVIVLTALWPTHAKSQVVGSISGSVFDSTNAAVPGAQVTATNQGTSVARSTTTGSAGDFVFTLLPIGTYSVQVSRSGFTSQAQKNISLEGQQNIRLEFKLVVGSVAESVNVTAEGTQEVQRVDPTLEQTIHAEQVAELPLNGRDFVQLALLAPGTSRSEQAGDFLNQGTSSEVSFRGSVSLSVQGMSEAANDWRYDGIDDNELTAGGVGFLPQIDAIQEFNVLTYNYSAQYGSRAGSTVLVSTKSGTNSFHGTLFEFLRNQIFDARNYFNLPGQKSPYRQNEFGGSIGGPIIKDKTFFFGDFQTNRVNQAPPIFATIPTAAQVSGVFTNPIFDPTTTIGGGAGSTRNSYWNGTTYKIPAGEISSVGQAILNIFPVTTVLPGTNGFPAGYNYESTPVRTLRDDEWDFRVDHTITDKDHMFARFSWDDAKQFNPSGLPGLGSSSSYFSTTYFTTHPRNMALSETHIFSSHIVNQVTAGYNKDFNYIRGLGYNTLDGNNIGIPGSNLGDPATSGMDLIAITGFNPIGDRLYSPYQGGTSIFHYLDALSVTKGTHTMVFGFDFRPMQQNGLGETYFHGYLSFNKNFSAQINSTGGFAATVTDPASGMTGANGNAIASLLLGYPDNGDRSNQVNSGIIGRRWKEYRGYAQDNWAVSRNLTLNLGVAYGVTTPLSEDHNRIANFDIQTGNFYVAGNGTTASANVFLANKYAGVSTDYSNIEPRFGFSYSPWGARKNLVIRGGIGIFHDVSHLGVSGGIHQNPPYTNTYTFSTNDITPARTIIPGSPIDGFPSNSAPQNPATYVGSLVANDKNFKQGFVDQYNLNIQQGLGNGTLFTLAYAGTHGDRMDNNPSYNVATPGTGNNPAARRPFPQYQTITYITGNGWLLYNSLQAKIERRTHGLYLLGSYTYAQATETGFSEGVSGTGGGTYWPLTLAANVPVSNGSGGTRATPLGPRDDRGASNLTLRNDFTASVVYSLPIGKGGHYLNNVNAVTDAVIGGWQTNMILISHDGYPLYFSQSTNTSGAGVTNRPDVVPNCNLYAGSKTVSQWFNPACFTTPTSQELGNAHRNYGYGPGRTNVDFSLYKNFAIYEAQKIEFRAEFFNILNHSQFGTPATGFGSATFGAISGTVENNRQIQFALKYIF